MFYAENIEASLHVEHGPELRARIRTTSARLGQQQHQQLQEEEEGMGEEGSEEEDNSEDETTAGGEGGEYLKRGKWKQGAEAWVCWRNKPVAAHVGAVWRAKNNSLVGANLEFPNGSVFYYTAKELSVFN
jgi:hypothetical protein